MEMDVRKSGDPFQVDPLPKTFYHPSKQRELSEDERKLCLSPDNKMEHFIKNPEDKKFLRKTNQIRIHEIPTRENGTTVMDHSSSSKFDESWPSTERAMVSTPEVDTETTETKTPSSEGGTGFTRQLLPNSTLARYIHRFRNNPPSSRHERDRMYLDSGEGGEFWWLSPSPPSSSTPKDGTPKERNLPFPPQSLSPKQKRTTARRASSSPTSPVSKTRSTLSPSTKSSFDGLDLQTAELQQRAKALLEKSESTLETSSTDLPIPSRRAHREAPKKKPPKEAPFQAPSKPAPIQLTDNLTQRQLHSAPPPEEDILYQWRLARKIERAQEHVTKRGPARSTFLLEPSQPRFIGARPEESLGLFGKARIPKPTSALCPSERDFLDPQSGLEVSDLPSTRMQTRLETPSTLLADQEGRSARLIPPHPSTMLLPGAPVVSAGAAQGSQPITETENDAHGSGPRTSVPSSGQITRQEILGQGQSKLVQEQMQFEQADVPSHVHLSCDILPCPHQKALIEKGRSDPTVKLPLSYPVVELMKEELALPERDLDRVNKLSRKTVRESHKRRQLRGKDTTEDKQKSQIELHHVEQDGQKRRAHQKQKPKREVSRETTATDVLTGVIGEVVSQRLFATPQSSTSSLTTSDDSLQQREYHEQHHKDNEENSNPDSNSDDNEFPDDEVLKILRQRQRNYRDQLRQIDNILNQQSSDQPPARKTKDN